MGLRLRGSLARSSIIAIVVLSLAAGVAASDALRFETVLRGVNENPDADPDGRGSANVRLDVEGGEVCATIEWNRIGTPNRAHIHVGGPEVNGMIVVHFFNIQDNTVSQFDPLHDQLEARPTYRDCVPADPAVLAQIEANPGGYYVNVHNARFPGGAIRGQLQAGD